MDDSLRDTAERIRACEILLALLAGLFAWLLIALFHTGVITWDDLAPGRAAANG